MPKLNTTAAEMVAKARATLNEVTTAEAMELLDDDNVMIVDIRDIRERQRQGYIRGSFHCPRGMAEFWVDPESPYHKAIFSQDKRFIFHCASGWRSALTAQTLNAMGFAAEHLRDGFAGWVKDGAEIETNTQKD